MENDLRALLVASSAVTALAPATSIQWHQRAGLPAVALWLVSDPADYTLEGEVNLTDAVVQIDSWAATSDAAKKLDAAVNAVLSGYRGGTFQSVQRTARRASREADSAAADGTTPTDFHRRSSDFRVRRTQP